MNLANLFSIAVVVLFTLRSLKPLFRSVTQIRYYRQPTHISTSLSDCVMYPQQIKWTMSFFTKKSLSRCRHVKERRRSAVDALHCTSLDSCVFSSFLGNFNLSMLFFSHEMSFPDADLEKSAGDQLLLPSLHAQWAGGQGGCHLYPSQVCMTLQYLSTSYLHTKTFISHG